MLKSYPIGGIESTIVGSLEPTLFLAYLRRFAAYSEVLFLPRHSSSTPEKCTRLLKGNYCDVPVYRGREQETERDRQSFWDLDFASLQLAIQVLRGGREK